MQSGTFVSVPWHEICSTAFAHIRTSNIGTFNLKERGKEYLIIVL